MGCNTFGDMNLLYKLDEIEISKSATADSNYNRKNYQKWNNNLAKAF